jgi:hypothetical protein
MKIRIFTPNDCAAIKRMFLGDADAAALRLAQFISSLETLMADISYALKVHSQVGPCLSANAIEKYGQLLQVLTTLLAKAYRAAQALDRIRYKLNNLNCDGITSIQKMMDLRTDMDEFYIDAAFCWDATLEEMYYRGKQLKNQYTRTVQCFGADYVDPYTDANDEIPACTEAKRELLAMISNYYYGKIEEYTGLIRRLGHRPYFLLIYFCSGKGSNMECAKLYCALNARAQQLQERYNNWLGDQFSTFLRRVSAIDCTDADWEKTASEAVQMQGELYTELQEIIKEFDALEDAINRADAECPVNPPPGTSSTIRPARVNIDKVNPILGTQPESE